jgi:hypothetical protein
MGFKFHHMNFCTDNLPRLTTFYKTLFELGTINNSTHTVISRDRDDRAYTGKVDFLTDGGVEFHLAERDLDTSASTPTTSRRSCVSVTNRASVIQTTAAGRYPVGTRSFCKIRTAKSSKCTKPTCFLHSKK